MWPPSRRTTRVALAALGAAAAAGLSAAVLGGRELPEDATPARVVRGDLVWTAEVEGELASRRRVELGPPPVPNVQFKLAYLAPEGAEVESGEVLLRFDTQLLEQRLQEARSEAASLARTRERRAAELEAEQLEAERQRLEAERRLEKARLEAEVPEDLVARVELEKARVEVASATEEEARLRARIESSKRQAEAELADLGSKLEWARERVTHLERDIEAMTVKAPRAGVVVYPGNWRGEKRGVGDTVWVNETLLQLPDLAQLHAEGHVPESDSGALAVGQPVRLRLDSREGEELRGTLVAVGRTVQPRSWRVRDRVVRVEIDIEEGAGDLRPGMRFRGEVETGREADVLQVPLEAVFSRDRGPVAWRCGALGCREASLELGRRSGGRVEVLSGLEDGDSVALLDLARTAERGR